MSQEPRRPARKPLNLGIANFKAFGAHPQTIPLKPITLVFGPNSGGKSSLLHYLLWLRDIIGPPPGRKNPLDVYWPSAGDANVELNGSRQGVDLGGFKQFRHGGDASAEVQNRMCLRLEGGLDVEVVSHFANCSPPTNYHSRLRAMVKDRLEKALQSRSLQDLLRWGETVAKKLTEDSLTQLISAEDEENQLNLWLEAALDRNNYPDADVEGIEVPKFNEVFEQECPKLSQYSPLNDLEFVVRDETPSCVPPPTEEELIAELQNLVCRMFDELKHKPLPPAESERPLLVRFEIRSGGSALMLAERNDAAELELVELDLGTLALLPGASKDLVARFSRFHRDSSGFRVVFNDANSWLPGSPRPEGDACEDIKTRDAILKLLESQDSDSIIFEGWGLLNLCQKAAEHQFGSLSYLGPIRAYPSRDLKIAALPENKDSHGWFAWRRLGLGASLRQAVNDWLRDKQTSLQVAVGHFGILEQFSASFQNRLLERIERRKREVLAKESLEHSSTGFDFDDWDAAADIQEALEAAAAPQRTETNASVFLEDSVTQKAVSCRDIGVGISQLIPVLVQAKDSQNEIILMEQPELHLHPRLQAELGDLFIESALERGNTFVLETHSEHLILRLLRRIRETTEEDLPDGKYALTPGQICVLYVEPGEQGSRIMELPVTPDGDFSRPWPKGFFVERTQELF